jgi:16S rRNA (cytidine1402-2'-O)-methyltransferase
VNYILEILRQGKNLALVSDAGTPGISDPGNRLISVIITSPGLVVKIVPLPGPSAVTAAASISGFPMDKFIFMGFPPAKRKKRKFFKEVSNSKYPVIFYESPYRVIKSLCDLRETDANQNAKPMRKIVVCRELTKKFEAIYRGTIDEIIKKIERSPSGGSPAGRKLKGEFAIVVEGK